LKLIQFFSGNKLFSAMASSNLPPLSFTPLRVFDSVSTANSSIHDADRQRQHAKFLIVFAVLTSITVGLGWIVPAAFVLPTFYLLVGAWGIFGCRTAAFLWQHGHQKAVWICVGLMVVLGVGVALPGRIFGLLLEPLDQVIDFLNDLLPSIFFFRGSAGKVGHVFCFAGLALVTLLYRKRLSISRGHWVIGFALLASATEGIQLFLKGRSPSLRDTGFDALGVMIGIAIFAIVRLIQQRLQHDWSKSDFPSDNVA